MNKIISHIYQKDLFLFREHCIGVRKIVQDTIFHMATPNKYQNKKNSLLKKKIEESMHTYFLSKSISTKILKKNSICYIRSEINKKELKDLKSGKYPSDIILDLHGLNKQQALLELGKLILICKNEKLFCASIIHGHGKNILKKHIPIWLSQHPDIIAFYQDSSFRNSRAAISVLIDF
ncbi:UPF0115 protein YfcN [Buchnera aphidicola (Thelaxes suberi)]|uniref:endonuclease SmrB n=1 Tax=Buchnera aphidicola TaxID=9 RepID=UPI0034642482